MMPFSPFKSFTIITAMHSVLATSGLCSAFLLEEPVCSKMQITLTQFLSSDQTIRTPKKTPSEMKTKKKKAKKTSSKFNPSDYSKIDSYFISPPTKKRKLTDSQDSSTELSSPETITLAPGEENKENLTSSQNNILKTFPSVTMTPEEKKRQQQAFNSLFQQPPTLNQFIDSILKQEWGVSPSGNHCMTISTKRSPDKKKHTIIITQSYSKFNGQLNYSAYIDESQKLGSWYPNMNLAKSAALNKIYKRS